MAGFLGAYAPPSFGSQVRALVARSVRRVAGAIRAVSRSSAPAVRARHTGPQSGQDGPVRRAGPRCAPGGLAGKGGE
jgi:hypothetical protein